MFHHSSQRTDDPRVKQVIGGFSIALRVRKLSVYVDLSALDPLFRRVYQTDPDCLLRESDAGHQARSLNLQSLCVVVLDVFRAKASPNDSRHLNLYPLVSYQNNPTRDTRSVHFSSTLSRQACRSQQTPPKFHSRPSSSEDPANWRQCSNSPPEKWVPTTLSSPGLSNQDIPRRRGRQSQHYHERGRFR